MIKYTENLLYIMKHTEKLLSSTEINHCRSVLAEQQTSHESLCTQGVNDSAQNTQKAYCTRVGDELRENPQGFSVHNCKTMARFVGMQLKNNCKN